MHHTAGGKFQDLETINRIHKRTYHDAYPANPCVIGHDEKNNITKYPYIVYHYLIDGNGKITQNRKKSEVGYHCGNWYVNNRSIAITFMGNYSIKGEFINEKQFNSFVDLLEEIKKEAKKPIRVFWHYQVWNTFTQCPW